MVNCSCLFSAFCFVVSNALGIAVIVQDKLRPSYNYGKQRGLDSDYLPFEWEHRQNIAPLMQTSHVFNLLAWLFLMPPILQVAWSLSRGGKRKVGIHTAIGGFVMAGCMTEILSRLLLLGGWGAAAWIARDFTLERWVNVDGQSDAVGWKVLELVYLVMQGLLTWVDAFEWICLFNILILTYFSIGTQMPEHRRLSLWWGRLGLLIAFLCFIDFSSDILRLEDWKFFASFSIFTAIVNTCLLLPLWLLWLSCTISNILPTTNDDDITSDPLWSAGVAGGAGEVEAPQVQNL